MSNMTEVVLPPAFVTALSHRQIVSYTDVLSSSILIYELVLMLPAEVEYIWMWNWSIVTIFYVVQRYIPLVTTPVLGFHQYFGANSSVDFCQLTYKIMAWFEYIGIVFTEILLTLRVWAVWGRSTRVGIGLAIFLLACMVPCIGPVQLLNNAVTFGNPPYPNFRGCLITGGSNILYVLFVLLMVYDAAMLMMMLIPGVSAYKRGGRSELVKTIYQDGVIYYVFVFLCSLTNVIVIRLLPPDLTFLLTELERVLHAVLASRVVLHIRQVSRHRNSAFQMTDNTMDIQFIQNKHGGVSTVSEESTVHNRFEMADM